jgi:flagellar motor switch protein FliN
MSEQFQAEKEMSVASDAGELTTTGRRALSCIPVQLRLVLGTVRLTIAELAAIKPGEVVPLNRTVGDPIDIYANEQLIARGQIVVLDETASTFGLKFTSIEDAAHSA